MDKRGFILTQVLVGLYLLGLIIVFALPLLNISISNLNFAKEKKDMINTGETVIEQIKSFNYKNNNDRELVFDMELVEIIELFEGYKEVNLSLPIDKDNPEYKYMCNIYKTEKDNLWELNVSIRFENGVKKINEIEINALLPIP